MPESIDLRDAIRAEIDRAGLSIDDLAKKSGVNRATIFRAISKNSKHVPSARTLGRIARALEEIIGPKTVVMHITPSGVKFTARPVIDVPNVPEEQQIVSVVSQLRSSLKILLELAISGRMKLSTEEHVRLFHGELFNLPLKLKLAVSLGAIDEYEALAISAFDKLGVYVDGVGENLSMSDPELLKLVSTLPLPSGRLTVADDPIVGIIGSGALLIGRLGSRADLQGAEPVPAS